MTPCSYSDFLRIVYAPDSLSIVLLMLMIKNTRCKIAFCVYILLLGTILLENKKSYTISIAQHTIAKDLSVHSRTIKRAIAFLENKGYLIITRNHPKKGGYQPNKIQIRFPEHLAQVLLNKMSLSPISSKEHHHAEANI
ncbi:MAG: HTH domain-containing protein [Gammaproteobacteria bacterium]|jgi:hypothetical protein|nr:HTH domain-containing protein [Gammaproteobacteria bacterium]